MAQIIKEIRVDVSQPNVFQAIVAKQNDCNSRFLKVTLTDYGTKINVEKTAKVTINANRPDGESQSFVGVANDDSTVTVPLAQWMLSVVGLVKCDISVIDTTDGERLTTLTFYVDVQEASNINTDVSENPEGEFRVITPVTVVDENSTDDKYPSAKAVVKYTNNVAAELSQELAIERERITNLSTLADGSTTGDAELQDIRVGADGTVYSSAGESVRTQNNNLNNRVNIVTNQLFTEVVGGITTYYPASIGEIQWHEQSRTLIIDTECSGKTYHVICGNPLTRVAFAQSVEQNAPITHYTNYDNVKTFDVNAGNQTKYILIFYANGENKGNKPFVYTNSLYDFNNVNNFLTNQDDYPIELKPSQVTTEKTYNAFDNLVSKYPNYVTKKVIGTDQSGTYNINQYTFMPKCVEITGHTPKPKHTIIIATGTHGDGIHPNATDGDGVYGIVATYMFMKTLCENYRNDRILNYIHHNVKIVVIPCRNPWGIDNKSRYNSRGVDLNRNFDYQWSKVDSTYGESACSEKETIAMQNVFNTEKADFSVDVHTRGGNTFDSNQPQILYLSNSNSTTIDIMQFSAGACLENNDGLKARIDLYDNSATRFEGYSEFVCGTPSCEIECYQWDIPLGDTVKGRGNTKRYNYELVANLIWRAISQNN